MGLLLQSEDGPSQFQSPLKGCQLGHMFPIIICNLETVCKLHFHSVKGKGTVRARSGAEAAELEAALGCDIERSSRCPADLTLKSVPGAGTHGAHSEGLSFSYLFGGGQGALADNAGWGKPPLQVTT